MFTQDTPETYNVSMTNETVSKELEELRLYKKKARYVMAKLHRELEELETINKALQLELENVKKVSKRDPRLPAQR